MSIEKYQNKSLVCHNDTHIPFGPFLGVEMSKIPFIYLWFIYINLFSFSLYFFTNRNRYEEKLIAKHPKKIQTTSSTFAEYRREVIKKRSIFPFCFLSKTHT